MERRIPSPRRASRGPGRPQKFGRPSRVVALTIPEDTVAWLHGIHPDLGWAIVALHERAGREPSPRPARAPELCELVQIPGRRALIVVEPEVMRDLQGVSTVPLEDGRAFLALEPHQGIADLEVAILDRLEEIEKARGDSRPLGEVLRRIRAWRRDPALAFRSRAIIIVEEAPPAGTRGASAGTRRRRSVRKGRSP